MTKSRLQLPVHKSAFSAVIAGEEAESYLYTVTFVGELPKSQAASASPSVAEEIKQWCQRKFAQRAGRVIIDLR